MSVIVNFAIFPTDKGISVSPYVARVTEYIRSKGYKSQLTAMSTIVETNTLDEALELLSKAYNILEYDCERVYLSANFDIKKGPIGRIDSKVESVEQKLL